MCSDPLLGVSCVGVPNEACKQASKQTGRQASRQAGKQANKQAGRQADSQAVHISRHTDSGSVPV